jgi:hypothetical protein
MPDFAVRAGYLLLVLAFNAGGAYFVLRQIRKDLNGVGRKVRAIEAKQEDRYLALVVAYLLIAPAETRQFGAKILLEAGKGTPP